jgi:hypothetical protein
VRSIAAACLIVVTLAVTAVGCGSSEDTTTVKTIAPTTTTSMTDVLDAMQLEQRDRVLAAIKAFDETDPGQLELWQDRAKTACELTYDLEGSYQNTFIEAFTEEHCGVPPNQGDGS